MVKAILFSLALHGALFWTLRRPRVLPRPPSPPVEFDYPAATRHEVTPPRVMARTAPVTTIGGGGAGAPRGRVVVRAIQSHAAPTIEIAPPVEKPAETPRPNLFLSAAIGHAAGVDLDARAPEGYRPRQGVGSVDGRGGTGVGDFLAEDAGRERAKKG